MLWVFLGSNRRFAAVIPFATAGSVRPARIPISGLTLSWLPLYPPFRALCQMAIRSCSRIPTGPWLSAVCHVRACNRYYGLMRQSDELRPAWACSACSGRSLPSRALRFTFHSLAVAYGRVYPSRGLPQPESPDHPYAGGEHGFTTNTAEKGSDHSLDRFA